MTKRRAVTVAWFVISMIGALLATQVAYAFSHSVVADAQTGDAVIDAVASSGPATGAVIILTFVLKFWFNEVKSDQKDVKDMFGKMSAQIVELAKDDARLREEQAAIKADQKYQNRRIDRLERKHGSAATRAADESGSE